MAVLTLLSNYLRRDDFDCADLSQLNVGRLFQAGALALLGLACSTEATRLSPSEKQREWVPALKQTKTSEGQVGRVIPAANHFPAEQRKNALQTVDGPLVPPDVSETVSSGGPEVVQYAWSDAKGRLIALADYNRDGIATYLQRYNYSPQQGTLEIKGYDGPGRVVSRMVHVGGPKKLPWLVFHYDEQGILRYITQYRPVRSGKRGRTDWREDFFEASAAGKRGRLLEGTRHRY